MSLPKDIQAGMSTALAERIAELNAGKSESNNGTGNTTIGTSNGNSSSSSPGSASRGAPNTGTNIDGTGNEERGTGHSGQSHRGTNTVSTSMRTDKSNEGSDRTYGSEDRPINQSSFSVSRTPDPAGTENEGRKNSRGSNGGENSRGSGNEEETETFVSIAPESVSIPLGSTPARRGRKPKTTDPQISEEIVTYALESIFSLTATIRGHHWVRTTEQCSVASAPIARCLSRLPSHVADKAMNLFDPVSAAISLYFLVIPSLQYEHALRTGQLPVIKDHENAVPTNNPSQNAEPEPVRQQSEGNLKGPKPFIHETDIIA